MTSSLLAFECVLLGLVVGVQPVALQVSSPVAAVTVLLDQEEVATLTAPPWELPVDFGARPMPRRLSAVGRNAAGEVVAATERLINVPRPDAQASLILQRGDSGRPSSVSLVWDSFAHPTDRPVEIAVELDGTRLQVDDPARILLPDLDLGESHLLTARVDLPGKRSLVTGLVFGGGLLESTAVRLTSIPVEADRAAAADLLQEARSRVRVAANAAEVVAIDDGPAHALVVVDVHIATALRARREILRRDLASAVVDQAEVVVDPTRSRRWQALLATDDSRPSYSIVLPRPRRVMAHENEQRNLYAPEWTFEFEPSSLDTVLGLVDVSAGARRGRQELGNAVAATALLATATGRPRAVVLVLASDGCETGAISARDARAFLGDLHVPFEVWSVRPSEKDCGWGPARDVSKPASLTAAMSDLRDRLAQQRIAWVAGDALPQSITVSDPSEPDAR